MIVYPPSRPDVLLTTQTRTTLVRFFNEKEHRLSSSNSMLVVCERSSTSTPFASLCRQRRKRRACRRLICRVRHFGVDRMRVEDERKNRVRSLSKLSISGVHLLLCRFRWPWRINSFACTLPGGSLTVLGRGHQEESFKRSRRKVSFVTNSRT